MEIIKIPYYQLTPEALKGLVEEFATRDGTDYGQTEVPLEHKTEQIMRQLQSGRAVIVFDPDSETCNILPAEDPRLRKEKADNPSD
ncbi:MAG: YheU family protein [Desulfococcaceae bacterium]